MLLRILSLSVCLMFAQPVLATTTMDTFSSEPHAAPESFARLSDGSVRGKTVDNEIFRQYRIVTDSTIRIQKFVIGSAYFYISDKGIIEADDDLMAVSVYLTRA